MCVSNRITNENTCNVLKTNSVKNIGYTATSVSFCFQKQCERQEKKSGFKVVNFTLWNIAYFYLVHNSLPFCSSDFFHACSTCCHLCFFPEECVHGVTVMSLSTFPNTMSRNVCNYVCLSSVVQSSFLFMQLLSSFFVIKKTDLKQFYLYFLYCW